MNEERLRQAAHHLLEVERLVVFTGAGASAESGIPTFRDARTGLWARYDPSELATRSGFFRDPGLVWRWYAWRRRLVEEASPNPGHQAIAALERHIGQVTVITQNIDDLHQRAGSREVLHLHGSLLQYKCFEEDAPRLLPEGALEADKPPRCTCGAPLRPDVVWFGEAVPREAWRQALECCQECELMLVVGTSGVVQPAASLPYVVKGYGGKVIEVNPEETDLTQVSDLFLAGRAGEILPRLVEIAFDGRPGGEDR